MKKRVMTRRQLVRRKRFYNSVGSILIFIGIIGALTISDSGNVSIYNIISLALAGIGGLLIKCKDRIRIK